MKGAAFAVCASLALVFFATGADASDGYVCGLNQAGMSLEQWSRGNGNRASFDAALLSDYSSLAKLQKVSRTDFKPDERRDLGLPPVIWLIQGASNAYA